jgi:hypothetical protein
MPSVVDQIAASFKGAIAEVELPDGASALDVSFALDKVKRDWVMPEKTHTIEPGPPPTGGEGGEGGGTPEPETPTITGLTPATTEVGVPVDVTVTGTGFTESSQVKVDTTPLISTFVSDAELTASVPGPLNPGTFQVTVDDSNPFPFEVTAPAGQRAKRS